MAERERLEISIEADTQPFADAIGNLEKLSQSFGRQLTGALKDAVVSGKSLDDMLRKIGMNLAGMALSQGLQPLSNLASGLFSTMFGGIGKALPFAKGGVVPFASGGVVSASRIRVAAAGR
ncbi:hypothetical protein L611_001100000510 [Aminobacter sp. J15]|nr:hypothetical protein L610_001400000630 [Aminobacter sp. J44]TWH35944.1 hypothetical protein L611_001100000510 [Aminobacter sp. J15]